MRRAPILFIATLLAACSAAPVSPALVEADPLPSDAPPLPPRRNMLYECRCEPDLVCCKDACFMCVRPGAGCPPLACRR